MLGVAAMASCSSGEPTPGVGHVENAGSRTPAPALSSRPGQVANHPAAVGPLSPLDWAIRDDCPPRPWSKNVPDRPCTKDSECGDGFCDAGRRSSDRDDDDDDDDNDYKSRPWQ